MMTIKATTDQLIKWVGTVIFVEAALTSIHHIYGGLVYATPNRLMMPIVTGIALVITLVVLGWYRRGRSGTALTLFCVLALIVWISMDLIDSIYGHTYKNILFLAGVPVEAALQIHPPLMAGDFVYPPNDLLFELSGVFKLVTIFLTGVFMYYLVRDRQGGYQSVSILVVSTLAVGLGILALIVGGSLLVAYSVTSQLSTGLLAVLVIAAGGVALGRLLVGFFRNRSRQIPLPQ